MNILLARLLYVGRRHLLIVAVCSTLVLGGTSVVAYHFTASRHRPPAGSATGQTPQGGGSEDVGSSAGKPAAAGGTDKPAGTAAAGSKSATSGSGSGPTSSGSGGSTGGGGTSGGGGSTGGGGQTAVNPLDFLKIGVYLSGNSVTSGTYPGTRMGNVYYNNQTVNVTALKSRIDSGESLNITAAAPGNPYISGIVSGDATALSWMNTFIGSIKTLSDYAKSKNNGTYVAASIYSEANGRIQKGQLPDYATTSAAASQAVGQAQQIFIRTLKQNAPNAVATLWNMGYDHTFEATQMAQITNPKPDIITIDPYENHICTGSVSTVTAGSGSYSITWYKSQPAYNGYVAISESGMATNQGCSDAQLAAFYTDIRSQVQTVVSSSGVKIPFWVMFNGTGSYPHDITNGSYPLALAALQASIANQ